MTGGVLSSAGYVMARLRLTRADLLTDGCPLSSSCHTSWPMRRRAQEILPWLYLGPAEASRDLPQLHSLGITAMLTVASAAEAAYILKPRYPQAFAYSVLPVEDRREQNLIVLVPQVRAFIDQVREQTNGKVLVHDDGGISRAPAIVILCVG